jgi:hypothetical protein
MIAKAVGNATFFRLLSSALSKTWKNQKRVVINFIHFGLICIEKNSKMTNTLYFVYKHHSVKRQKSVFFGFFTLFWPFGKVNSVHAPHAVGLFFFLNSSHKDYYSGGECSRKPKNDPRSFDDCKELFLNVWWMFGTQLKYFLNIQERSWKSVWTFSGCCERSQKARFSCPG